jgi:hypothetical protein
VCLELEEHLSNLLLKKPLYITTTATWACIIVYNIPLQQELFT